MIFLLLHDMCDLMFHVLPFAVLSVATGCKYNVYRVLLHREIPGFCIPRCVGSEIDVNFGFC